MQQETPSSNPVQGSEAAATLVFGQDYPIPEELYIPPEALRVQLRDFAGPLDLLLYLIRKQRFNLLDIPIVLIAEQYNSYIDLMLDKDIDLASEYLVMATTLARIKSRMLLPAPPSEDGDEEADPRRELVNRLLEYERYAQAARSLAEQPRIGREVFDFGCALDPGSEVAVPPPQVEMADLVKALERALDRARQMRRYAVGIVTIDVQERVYGLYRRLYPTRSSRFDELLDIKEGVMGVVVNFFSILCLWNVQAIELTQAAPGADIFLRASTRYDSTDALRRALSGSDDLQNL